MDLPGPEKPNRFIFQKIALKKKENIAVAVNVADLVTVEQLLDTRSLSFKTTKKGGFHVALE